MCPLDKASLTNVSLGQSVPDECVPRTMRPRRMCPLDKASLTNVSLGQSVPDECVMTLDRTADNRNSYMLAATQASLT
jgi:hypothetical protein